MSEENIGKTLPPDNQWKSVTETPSKHRVMSSSSYRTGSIEEQRSAIIEDLGGEVEEVTLDYFFDHILPSLPNDVEVAKVVDSLKNTGHIVTGKWAAFERNPSEDDRHEIVVFQPLVQVFDSIITAATPLLGGAKQTLELKLNPKNPPYSERNRQLKPDGIFLLINRTLENPPSLAKGSATKRKSIRGPNKLKDSWYEIVAPAAFKKSATGKDNVSS